MKMKYIIAPSLIIICIVLNSFSWCSSTDVINNHAEVSIVLNIAPEYAIDPDDNMTHINISGSLIVTTMDPRMYTINLQVDSEKFPVRVSPTTIYGSGSGSYSFTITVKVLKVAEDTQNEIIISGSLKYVVGAPVSYSIGSNSEIMYIKVLSSEVNSDDNNMRSNRETLDLNMNIMGVVFILVIICFYYNKRQ